MKSGIDYCAKCHGSNLFDTQDDDGHFITVCNECGSVQQDLKCNENKRVYFYRGDVITPYGGGWFSRSGDLNIYKTIDDAKNAIDKHLGGFSTARVPKRHSKPIETIGTFEEVE